MAKRHHDRRQYFDEQTFTTRKYVIPYIENIKSITPNSRILEIGCGEGGNMRPFLERGCEVIGVDINSAQLERAGTYYKEIDISQPRLIDQNIYEVKDLGTFDIIVLRDVIEHIPNQERFMKFVQGMMKPDGVIFFGFPPWYMPFGGHQQMCRTKMGKLPWMHVLPKKIYQAYLRLVGEDEPTVQSRMEIVDTRISIERFYRIVKLSGLKFEVRTLFLFNPNYEIKFGIKPRRTIWPFSKIPFFRNFYSTCCYAIVSK